MANTEGQRRPRSCRGRNADTAPPALLGVAGCPSAGPEYHSAPRPWHLAAGGAAEASSGRRTARRCLAPDASEARGPVEQAASAGAPSQPGWTAWPAEPEGCPADRACRGGQDPPGGACCRGLRPAPAFGPTQLPTRAGSGRQVPSCCPSSGDGSHVGSTFVSAVATQSSIPCAFLGGDPYQWTGSVFCLSRAVLCCA